tara:strand:- start:20293 stop:20601 length:309 start_codon:yes stop_codon:yes gene_type:complete
LISSSEAGTTKISSILWSIFMSRNDKKSSSKQATNASQVLRDPASSKTAKMLAASTLSQSNTSKQTGAKTETIASKVLTSEKYNAKTKQLAGSVLSQSNKNR